MLQSTCQQIWKTQQWPQDWKRSAFIQIPKKGNANKCLKYCIIVLILPASKVIFKILHTRLQQCVNWELPDIQAGFWKGIGTRDQALNICWVMKKAMEFQRTILFCFTDYAKAFDYVDHKKLWKILQEMGISEHLICLLRNLYAHQLEPDNGLVQNCERSTSRLYIVTLLFNFYAKYIIWNARLDESQAGIKIAGRNINNFIYADDTTLIAESEEKLKSLLMRVKEESEKVGLKLKIKKPKIMVPSPHSK